ncbi:sterol binding ankyrin repeat protein [Schizosaccharomyces japonicus yFS275]|uniref:Sterol binding ankyrin repeat protein n=1 Tax=Schizosaccharomyces japonicus (strain yFS275 / FY16936) TaxID=402676 RepID=B6JVE7_SCHJY|nr:sterol binding ankyrin repeat protein [Schizosaccharomyces japonicus yFS275]EEB05348.1 sterol binding ankyrin repeat protein [Schizosaccharomyces japonicus yFS275]
METVEVRSKDLLVRWLKVKENSVISWQVQPKRKSIRYAIYRKPGDGDDKNQHGNETKTGMTGIGKGRLAAAGLVPFYEGTRCMPDKPHTGSVLVKQAGLYAFVLDNTFSKNTAKTVTFILTVQCQPTLRPDMSTNDVKNQLLSGILLKKRRKKAQGYARRFFVLNVTEGTLTYYATSHSSAMRGKIPVGIAVISVSADTREINVDTGAELWNLKARSVQDWRRWCNAIERTKALHSAAAVPSSTEYTRESAFKQLSSIHARLRECVDIAHTYRRAQQSKVSISPSIPDIRIHLSDEAIDSHGSENPSSQPNNSTSDPNSQGSRVGDNTSAGIVLRRVTRLLNSLLHEVECFVQHYEFHRELAGQASPLSRNSIDSTTSDSWFDATDSASIMQVTHDKDSMTSSSEDAEDATNFTPNSLHKESSGSAQESVSNTLSTESSSTDSELTESSFESSPDLQTAPPSPDTLATSFEDETLVSSPSLRSSVTKHSRPLESSLSVRSTVPPKQQPKVPETFEQQLLRTIYHNHPLPPLPHARVKRRQTIPAITEQPPSMFQLLRKNIGKDVSAVTVPVVSNEPCSLLQRISEDLEYSELLDKANEASADMKMFYIVAFAISNFSNMRHKERSVRKVFSPLLGETFELVREDKNFRFIAEKVSHRPLIVASHAESPNWVWNHSPKPVQKFWGKSMELNTLGPVTIKLACGSTFKFVKPSCFLKNVAIGEKYVEPYDHLIITDLTTLDKAKIQFKSGGLFSGRNEDFVAHVTRKNGTTDSRFMKGKWTSHVSICSSTDKSYEKRIWSVGKLVNKPESHCGMTVFASQLNEITKIEEGMLPPTDTRLRPDQRYRENNILDKAEPLKLELEQKQRERRKAMEKNQEQWQPKWFKQVSDEHHEGPVWQLTQPDDYWQSRMKHSWGRCPKLW